MNQNINKKREDIETKHLIDASAFIEYPNNMNDFYSNTDNFDLNRKRSISIVFDGMIADIMTNKKFQTIIKELFIRCRKLNISLVLITEFYFSVPKEFRLNSTHYLIIKIHHKRELQQIAINLSADIDYKDFDLQKIYKRIIFFFHH